MRFLDRLKKAFADKGKPQPKTQRISREEFQRRADERRATALKHFPFDLVEVSGKGALAKWRELKSAGKGSPVVLGGGNNLDNLLEVFLPADLQPPFWRARPLEAVLAAAEQIKFPDDLATLRETDQPEPTLGEWPDVENASGIVSPGLTVAVDILTRKPLDKVYLAIIPTDDWTTIPAYLHWGGWNENPAPEWHVAALRSWRDRHGVELVGLSADVMDLTVAKKPRSREEAIALAREQYAYCSDIVEQGCQTISVLARGLMDSDWWYFWWD